MRTRTLGTRRIDVPVDGGSNEGRLVMADGKLAAVLVCVSAADVDELATEGGWFLEAGFGPCGALKVSAPGVFRNECDALAWIAAQTRKA